MCRWISALAAACLPLAAAAAFDGIGRAATGEEIRAWDIDVRADFKGLPPGSGSVRQGEEIWEAKCASCHGSFGESNQTFPPIAGGVTRKDMEAGRVAALARAGEQRTTLMKLSQVSTLWDYINRAMPWNAPKTLAAGEVYALTAYILSLDKIVPDDFVLSDANIGEVQRRLPNRSGMTRAHGLWDVRGKPDVSAKACMQDCPARGTITSQLPESARGNHGDLSRQNRVIGPVRGVALATSTRENPPAVQEASARAIAERSGCLACHGSTTRVVGPSIAEIAGKYAREPAAEARLVEKVRAGGSGAWGSVPMPPQSHLKENELRAVVRWLLTGQ